MDVKLHVGITGSMSWIEVDGGNDDEMVNGPAQIPVIRE